MSLSLVMSPIPGHVPAVQATVPGGLSPGGALPLAPRLAALLREPARARLPLGSRQAHERIPAMNPNTRHVITRHVITRHVDTT